MSISIWKLVISNSKETFLSLSSLPVFTVLSSVAALVTVTNMAESILLTQPKQICLFGNVSLTSVCPQFLFNGFLFAVFIPSFNLFFVCLCALTCWTAPHRARKAHQRWGKALSNVHEPKLDVYFPKANQVVFICLNIMKRAKSRDKSHLRMLVWVQMCSTTCEKA